MTTHVLANFKFVSNINFQDRINAVTETMKEKNKKKEKTHDRLATIHEDTSSFFREQLQKQRDKTRKSYTVFKIKKKKNHTALLSLSVLQFTRKCQSK